MNNAIVSEPKTLPDAEKLYKRAKIEMDNYHEIAKQLGKEKITTVKALTLLNASRAIWGPLLDAIYASDFGPLLFKANGK